ncbi:hypothetical protein [Mesobacillus subterraneus]|uniref:Uncharacterized protein n=1 Tax=Mesobacillus subterraneus TaxID=285983 RepID=A0A427TXG5_9BACI|nr:hypothetical protein [Mesobacillus subterraneus]RSD28960.1 hypothetical protein EJA10_02280 [Mesobacillus subterraneus]
MRKVICKNNNGIELEFNIDEEYEVEREFENTYTVINKLGKKHTVFKTHFEPNDELKPEV